MENKIIEILESIQTDIKNIKQDINKINAWGNVITLGIENTYKRFDEIESQVKENNKLLKALGKDISFNGLILKNNMVELAKYKIIKINEQSISQTTTDF